jgi:hypothetical protein
MSVAQMGIILCKLPVEILHEGVVDEGNGGLWIVDRGYVYAPDDKGGLRKCCNK